MSATTSAYVVVLNHCTRYQWNQKGTGVSMDFTEERKGSFSSMKDAVNYIGKNTLLLPQREAATFYILFRKDNSTPEKTIYFYRNNDPVKGFGFIGK